MGADARAIIGNKVDMRRTEEGEESSRGGRGRKIGRRRGGGVRVGRQERVLSVTLSCWELMEGIVIGL